MDHPEKQGTLCTRYLQHCSSNNKTLNARLLARVIISTDDERKMTAKIN
jgi:hypothetical protein